MKRNDMVLKISDLIVSFWNDPQYRNRHVTVFAEGILALIEKEGMLPPVKDGFMVATYLPNCPYGWDDKDET